MHAKLLDMSKKVSASNFPHISFIFFFGDFHFSAQFFTHKAPQCTTCPTTKPCKLHSSTKLTHSFACLHSCHRLLTAMCSHSVLSYLPFIQATHSFSYAFIYLFICLFLMHSLAHIGNVMSS